MSLRQDRLTFFGVLVAVVVAVLGYLQLGTMYPVEGRAEEAGASRAGGPDASEQAAIVEPVSDLESAARQEEASP